MRTDKQYHCTLVLFNFGGKRKNDAISNTIIEAYIGNTLNISIEGCMPRHHNSSLRPFTK